ncbi:hypothetical protein [Psychromonas sp. CD1]|uniref:hypothetical protein n=1 Tax=Psychromonas sp. CD1 TaxID=1979839 RepID=UPI000B9B87F0|nr:hypothetical protein [Psychromonas sp. CD1]
MKIKLLLIFFLSFVLGACTDGRQERLSTNIQSSEYLLQVLSSDLENNHIRNALLLREYANILAQKRPELKSLLTQLSQDSTTRGTLYSGLVQRLKTLKEQPTAIGDIEAQLFESESLMAASDPNLFNDALSDPVNVIADMSEGTLARVNAVSQSLSLQANQAEDNGAGSQLVGNPGYGQWQTNSSGMSFWQWYGMYAMFSALAPNPIRYDRWSSRRDYSYYNDVGRNRYTSPNNVKKQDNLAKKTQKQFSGQGRFKSPYAKSRMGASSMSSSSQTAQRTRSFSGKSSYSKAKASSSFRNSLSTTSRGIRRGK